MQFFIFHSAVNSENGEANKVKNQLSGEYSGVPSTARSYKVCTYHEVMTSFLNNLHFENVSSLRLKAFHGLCLVKKTTEKEAAENMLHWSRDTLGGGPSL